jgi:hypothetical protein
MSGSPLPYAPAIGTLARHRPIDYRLLTLVSLALSAWLIAIDPLINNDAIFYLRAAQAWLAGGLDGGTQYNLALYNQPLLPVAIAGVHQLTGLSLIHAGQLLNTLLYAALCVGFVSVTAQLGGDRRVQLFAALIILLHPQLSGYRSSITLDPGYWTFLLLALRQLLHYLQRPNWRSQLYWLAFMGVASLFRYEGLVLLAFAPLSLWFALPRRQRLRGTVRFILPALALLGLLLFTGSWWAGGYDANNVISQWQQLQHALQGFSRTVGPVTTTIPTPQPDFPVGDSSWVALGGVLALMLVSILRNLGLPGLALFGLGLWRHAERRAGRPLPAGSRAVINVHLATCLTYLVLLTVVQPGAIERDSAVVVLLLLVYLPFILEVLWQGSQHRRMLRILTVLSFIAMAGATLHNSDYRKSHIADAGRWLRDNTPASATLLTNNPQLAWASGRRVDWQLGTDLAPQDILEGGLWRHHQYIAVSVEANKLPSLDSIALFPALEVVRVFNNRQRDLVLILENSAYGSRSSG